jgi:hypothetical protein
MILTKNTNRLQASSSPSQSESPAAVPLAGRDGSANLTSCTRKTVIPNVN